MCLRSLRRRYHNQRELLLIVYNKLAALEALQRYVLHVYQTSGFEQLPFSQSEIRGENLCSDEASGANNGSHAATILFCLRRERSICRCFSFSLVIRLPLSPITLITLECQIGTKRDAGPNAQLFFSLCFVSSFMYLISAFSIYLLLHCHLPFDLVVHMPFS